MTKKITFSHRYGKLPIVDKQATLIGVFESNFKDIGERFREYDTLYWENDERGEKAYYKLPKSGKCLILLFVTDETLFTTIRSAFPERKVDYYKKAVGEIFNIIIND